MLTQYSRYNYFKNEYCGGPLQLKSDYPYSSMPKNMNYLINISYLISTLPIKKFNINIIIETKQ